MKEQLSIINPFFEDEFVEEYSHVVWNHIDIVKEKSLAGMLHKALTLYKNRPCLGNLEVDKKCIIYQLK